MAILVLVLVRVTYSALYKRAIGTPSLTHEFGSPANGGWVFAFGPAVD